MWPVLALVGLVGAILLHLGWRRRCARLEGQLARVNRELTVLEEVQRQRQLRQQLGTQTLFHHMAEGVLVLNAAGRIELANPALVNLLGVSGEVVGQTLMEAFRLPDLSLLVERLAREKAVLGHELTLPGLQERCLNINAVRLADDAGQPEGVLLVLHDLTPLRQLQSARQEFVANVSHELRTPLTLIKGCVETLLDGAQEDPRACERFLRTIDKHADRLTYLIEDLLTLSHLESGRLALNLRPTRLAEVAARVLEDLAARALEKRVTLRHEVPAELQAQADGQRLEQVLSNLVDNAIKYGRAGGTVVLQGERLADGRAQLSVRDDGPGIPAEAQSRLFERFYRLDKARSRDQGGTGLGLAIVKHIVQHHGGEIALESTVGKGSCFLVRLPAPAD
jgi:two-component system phosphate regulon sensor histidine kinase PhoR